MDKITQKKLRKIGYVIPQTCETCIHSKIEKGQDFGVCALISIQPHKDSTDVKDLTTYRGGRCEEFYCLNPHAEKNLGAWAEFLDRRKFTRSNRHKQKVRY